MIECRYEGGVHELGRWFGNENTEIRMILVIRMIIP